jgi:hypothetical protein
MRGWLAGRHFADFLKARRWSGLDFTRRELTPWQYFRRYRGRWGLGNVGRALCNAAERCLEIGVGRVAGPGIQQVAPFGGRCVVGGWRAPLPWSSVGGAAMGGCRHFLAQGPSFARHLRWHPLLPSNLTANLWTGGAPRWGPSSAQAGGREWAPQAPRNSADPSCRSCPPQCVGIKYHISVSAPIRATDKLPHEGVLLRPPASQACACILHRCGCVGCTLASSSCRGAVSPSGSVARPCAHAHALLARGSCLGGGAGGICRHALRVCLSYRRC